MSFSSFLVKTCDSEVCQSYEYKRQSDIIVDRYKVTRSAERILKKVPGTFVADIHLKAAKCYFDLMTITTIMQFFVYFLLENISSILV